MTRRSFRTETVRISWGSCWAIGFCSAAWYAVLFFFLWILMTAGLLVIGAMGS